MNCHLFKELSDLQKFLAVTELNLFVSRTDFMFIKFVYIPKANKYLPAMFMFIYLFFNLPYL